MARIRFEPAGLEVDAPKGARLIDLTDEYPDNGVPFSCRSASCGTCRVAISGGDEPFLPPDDAEIDVLEIFGEGPSVRLCCQLEVAKESDALITLAVCDLEG